MASRLRSVFYLPHVGLNISQKIPGKAWACRILILGLALSFIVFYGFQDALTFTLKPVCFSFSPNLSSDKKSEGYSVDLISLTLKPGKNLTKTITVETVSHNDVMEETESQDAAVVGQVTPMPETYPDYEENVPKIPLIGQLYKAGHDITNSQLCNTLGPEKLLILITSAPKHTEARNAIRQSWGSYAKSKNIVLSFVLGRPLTHAVKAESDIHNDIIVCKNMDSYSNLTLKSTCIMEWIATYCPRVKFVLKTDDDMFINIPRLIYFVQVRAQYPYKRTIFGKLARHRWPFRNPASKYYVPWRRWPATFWPDFMTGPAYLLTGDLVKDLYARALVTAYLKLEDVLMTGIVGDAIGARRVHQWEFRNLNASHSLCNVKRFISIHHIKPSQQYELLLKSLDSRECTSQDRRMKR